MRKKAVNTILSVILQASEKNSMCSLNNQADTIRLFVQRFFKTKAVISKQAAVNLKKSNVSEKLIKRTIEMEKIASKLTND